MNDEAVLSFLENRGYLLPLPVKYGEWLGVYPGYVIEGSDGEMRGRMMASRWARGGRRMPTRPFQ